MKIKIQIINIIGKIFDKRISFNCSIILNSNVWQYKHILIYYIIKTKLYIFIENIEYAYQYKLSDDEIFDKKNNTVVPKFVREADGRIFE